MKLKYMDLGLEDINYGQADLRLRKEFSTDNGSINFDAKDSESEFTD